MGKHINTGAIASAAKSVVGQFQGQLKSLATSKIDVSTVAGLKEKAKSLASGNIGIDTFKDMVPNIKDAMEISPEEVMSQITSETGNVDMDLDGAFNDTFSELSSQFSNMDGGIGS
jgi:hypothetical protein